MPASLQLLAVKDNITTSDLATTCGSSILKSHVSPFEATVVEILRPQGAHVRGKTNLDEFGMGSHSINSFFGPVHSDSTPRRSVGGSSGGSALATAKGVTDFALGTDTGGSVRLPAAYTGVVGFKPSYGLISRNGVVPYANSLDTVGIFTRETKDLHRILSFVRSHDDQDPTSLSETAWKRARAPAESGQLTDRDYFAGLTIGFPLEYNIEELQPAIRQAWMDTLSVLREKGCKIVPVSLPSTKHALSAYYILAPAEAASNLSKYDGVRYGTRDVPSDGAGHVLYSETRGEGFGDEVKRRILLGSYTLSATAIDNYFIKAQKVRRLVQRDFDRVFKKENPLLPPQQFDISDMHESIPLQNKLGPSQVDFILCPTAPTLPPTLEDALNQTGVDSYMNDVFTVPASLAGIPAISIPCKIPKQFQEKDQPHIAGLQIIGQYGDDFRVLGLSRRLSLVLGASHLTPDPTIISPTKERMRNAEFKTDAARPDTARPEQITKRLAHPWMHTEIEASSNPEGPSIKKHFCERVVTKNVIIKHLDLSKSSEELEISSPSNGPRIEKYTPRHVQIKRKALLKKFPSEKGEYHRRSLTDGEASNMLLGAFDDWSQSGQGRGANANAMSEREILQDGRPENGNRVIERKTEVTQLSAIEEAFLDEIDDIDYDLNKHLSWNDAIRSSKQSAPNAGSASSQTPDHISVESQNSGKSVNRNTPLRSSNKKHSAGTRNDGVSTPQNEITDYATPKEPQQAKDNWTKLLESFENLSETVPNANTAANRARRDMPDLNIRRASQARKSRRWL